MGTFRDLGRQARERRPRNDVDDPPDRSAPDDVAWRSLRPFALCADLLREGRPEAAKLLERCTRDHPGHAPGWVLLGDTLVELGRHEAALVCFTRARRVAPTAEHVLRVGVVLRALARPGDARAAFAEAAERDPTSVRARFLLGAAAQDVGDPAGAAAAYEAALDLDPRLGEAALNLGTVRQAMGDLDGARAAYGRAARLRPDGFGRAAQALTMESRGELWLDLGALRRALNAA